MKQTTDNKTINEKVLDHPLVKHLLQSLPEDEREKTIKTIVELTTQLNEKLPAALTRTSLENK